MTNFNKEIIEIEKNPFNIFKIENFFQDNFYYDIKKLFHKLDPGQINLSKNFGNNSIPSQKASFSDNNENEIFSKLNKIIYSKEFFYFFLKNFYFKNAMSQGNILRSIRYLRYPINEEKKNSILDFIFSKISVSYNFNFIGNQGGIVPHVDAQSKYLTLLLYFPEENQNEKEIEYGTTFWSSKRPNFSNTHILDKTQVDKFKEENKILFKSQFVANCLYGFTRNNFSWHTVEPIDVNSNYVRKTININFKYNN